MKNTTTMIGLQRTMPNRILPFALALLLAGLQGCMPRGESYTLDQVHGWAKDRYQSAMKEFNPKTNDVKASLSEVESLLGKLETTKGSDVAPTSQALADALNKLAPHAGYTSRPAFGALSEQYRVLAGKGKVTTPQAKLIATRTYSLLTSELEGVKFAL